MTTNLLKLEARQFLSEDISTPFQLSYLADRLKNFWKGVEMFFAMNQMNENLHVLTIF